MVCLPRGTLELEHLFPDIESSGPASCKRISFKVADQSFEIADFGYTIVPAPPTAKGGIVFWS